MYVYHGSTVIWFSDRTGFSDRIQIDLYLTNEELTFVMNNEWTKASLCSNAKLHLPEYYMMQHIHIYSFC